MSFCFNGLMNRLLTLSVIWLYGCTIVCAYQLCTGVGILTSFTALQALILFLHMMEANRGLF